VAFGEDVGYKGGQPLLLDVGERVGGEGAFIKEFGIGILLIFGIPNLTLFSEKIKIRWGLSRPRLALTLLPSYLRCWFAGLEPVGYVLLFAFGFLLLLGGLFGDASG
jgi:hypothetical protein